MKNKQITLIYPPDTNVLDAEKYPPLSLLFVASALRNNNIKTEILELGNKSIDSYKQVDYAPIFGITSTTASYPDAIKFTEGLKQQYPNSKIIFGGAHATAVPTTIPLDIVDTVVTGECEGNISAILEAEGVINGKRPASLDNLFPLPWDLVDINRYLYKDIDMEVNNVITTLLTRGCTHHCTFCYNPWRGLSPFGVSSTAVNREIKYLTDKFDINGISFTDDNTGLHIEKYLNILKKYDIQWSMETGIPEVLKNDLINRSIDSGCVRFLVGVESGSDKMLKLMKKPHRTNMIREAIEQIKLRNQYVRIMLLAGYPGETWATVDKTINFINSLPLDDRDSIAINMLSPYPGTDLYDNPDKYDITWISEDWTDFRPKNKEREFQIAFETEDITRQERLKMANTLAEAFIEEGKPL